MDRTRVKKQVKEAFAFFSPNKVIAREHLSRQDVEEIKKKLVSKMSPINILLATLFLVANLLLILVMNLTTGGKQVEIYGPLSLAGQIVGAVGSHIAASLIGISYYPKTEKTVILLRRVAGDLLFLSVLIEMIFSIYTDALMGFTTANTSLSPAIILFVVIMLVQPAYWFDAVALDLSVVISLIVTSIYCSNAFGMKGLPYYIAIAAAFTVGAYIVISLLFYAETQKYCQVLQTERIHNVALYDELTKCKNRNALKEYLAKNKRNWEGKTINLLLIMFDIDNFKEYNDQFSHLGGDYCLKTISEAVRKEFDIPNLEFYRWGGEEFLLFFELRNINDSLPILKRLREAIHNAHIDAPEGAPKEIVTISIGGHLIVSRDIFVFNKELSVVDEYLYKAKNAGKDVICYNGDLIISDDNKSYSRKKNDENVTV